MLKEIFRLDSCSLVSSFEEINLCLKNLRHISAAWTFFLLSFHYTFSPSATDNVLIFSYFKNNRESGLHLANSEDGISCRRLYDEPFLLKGTLESWNETEPGHPGAFKDGDGKYHLFYQGNPDIPFNYLYSFHYLSKPKHNP